MDISLRLLRDDDFDALHAIVSDYDVVKMTSSWPFPADESFTRMRMATPEARSGAVMAITEGGEFAGVVGIVDGDVGYHIGQAYWGQGIMTRALELRLEQEFAKPDAEGVKSCVWVDNPASARVLEKLGFKRSHTCRDFSKARDEDVDAIHFTLTRADWEKRAVRP